MNDMESEQSGEWKPCPFCGGEADVMGDDPDPGWFTVRCQTCFAQVQPRQIEQTAINDWNGRVSELELI